MTVLSTASGHNFSAVPQVLLLYEEARETSQDKAGGLHWLDVKADSSDVVQTDLDFRLSATRHALLPVQVTQRHAVASGLLSCFKHTNVYVSSSMASSSTAAAGAAA